MLLILILVIARLFALAGFIMLVVQVLLTSRLPVFKPFIPYDRLTKIHRSAGIVAAVLIFIHVLLIGTSKVLTGNLTVAPFTWFGVGSAVLLAAAVATALWYKRWSLTYEVWRGLHVLMYLVVGLAFIHALFSGTYVNSYSWLRVLWYVLAGLVGLVLLWRLFRVARMVSRPLAVAETIRENHDTVTIRFKGKPFSHRSGQFMFVRFPGRKSLKGTHPFTISAPSNSEDLAITVKAVGDFTSALPALESGAKAWVEGPYGGFTLPVYRGSAGKSAAGGENKDVAPLVFIAGGIGITPFLSILRELASLGAKRRVILVWGNKTEEDILRKEELEVFRSKIDGFSVLHVLSEQKVWEGETGFIDMDLLRKHVSDWEHTIFYLCGPPVMMEKLLAGFSQEGIPMGRISWERFAL